MVSCLICDLLSILIASVRAAVSKGNQLRIREEPYHWDPRQSFVVFGCTPVDLIGSPISASFP